MTTGGGVFSAGRLGPLTLRNRIVKSATNEGMSRGGLVTEQLVGWHRAIAAGGVAMTTLAYCSVSERGRTFRDQIWLRREAVPGLRSLTDAVHGEGAAASIQLGHAGFLCPPRVTRRPPLAPSRRLSPYAQAFSVAMTEADFDEVSAQYVAAARLCGEAGFDAIEVHVGHGYLLSQFLSPYNNRRKDRYGGSIENRARFPRAVLRAVRDAAPARMAVYAKLNMEDGFRGGMTTADGLATARMIEADGSVDALQLTVGHTTRTPMYLMRGGNPLPAMARDEPNPWRRIGMRVFARFLRDYPFEEAFLLPLARRFRAELSLPLMLLGGINRLDTMQAAIAGGFDFVTLGRALVYDPDFVAELQRGAVTESGCNHCNLCVAEMEREHTRCVVPHGAYRPG
jgi:2,4-dienoyl-CoA reductase-like NADH-dependent reductase (Old Yellow Enzyme family)